MNGDSRTVIGAALAAQLREQGWSDERIGESFIIDDSLLELEREERNQRILMNRRGSTEFQKYQPNRHARRRKR